jgi:hypothetical protein
MTRGNFRFKRWSQNVLRLINRIGSSNILTPVADFSVIRQVVEALRRCLNKPVPPEGSPGGLFKSVTPSVPLGAMAGNQNILDQKCWYQHGRDFSFSWCAVHGISLGIILLVWH